MTIRNTLGSRYRARYGAAAIVAAFATNSYLRSHSVAFCEGPSSESSSLTLHPQSNEISRRQHQSLSHPASPKRGAAGLIPDAESSVEENDIPTFDDDDTSAWEAFSHKFSTIIDAVGSIPWSRVPDRITDFIVPGWARQLPDYVAKLQAELSLAPGSLADDIWKEAGDVDINPEILWNARVRIGSELCDEETAFRRRRRRYVTRALAKYLDLKEEDVHPDDVPTIAMCGSGGGLRALVAGASSYLSAQEAGLFDCVTYTSGVSGSCWLQTLYFSSFAGQDFHKLIDHLKNRIGVHIAFPPPALKAITSAPTNKFLLSGFVEKLKGDPGASWGLVDIYGLLLAARLLVPKGELQVSDSDLKLSNQRYYVDTGNHPLPIYTAVRHEIPIDEKDKKALEEGKQTAEDLRERAKEEAYFSWYELTPHEFFSEELSAGIPTWSLGRTFVNGQNKLLESGMAPPELRVPLLFGIFGSAFCATLSHYYKELRPALIGLTGFQGVDSLVADQNESMVKLHPIDPATIPNFVMGMKEQLPATCPDSVFKNDHIPLMDAGMSNNLPIYPLLRPGRDVDVLIAFDASADVKRENWLSVVDGYARQRGIKAWPIGTGWPQSSSKPDENAEMLEEAQATSSQEAAMKVTAAREQKRREDSDTQTVTEEGKHIDPLSSDLGYCTVWCGTTEERVSDKEPPPSKRLSAQSENERFGLMEPNAGMTVIYFPLLPNPKVPGVDPDKTDFLSTWNFVYTPENIDSVVDLARADFEEGREQTRAAIRAVYERKKISRLKRENESLIEWWERKLHEGGDHFN